MQASFWIGPGPSADTCSGSPPRDRASSSASQRSRCPIPSRSNTPPRRGPKPGSIFGRQRRRQLRQRVGRSRSTASTRLRGDPPARPVGDLFEAVEYATLEWVDWFNNQRLLGPIGNIPPAEAEANHYAAEHRTSIHGCMTRPVSRVSAGKAGAVHRRRIAFPGRYRSKPDRPRWNSPRREDQEGSSQ